MRTTLDIDDDLLAAAKELARQQKRSAGEVVSQLLRRALTEPTAASARKGRRSAEAPVDGGFRPFASRGEVVSNERIDALRDEAGA